MTVISVYRNSIEFDSNKEYLSIRDYRLFQLNNDKRRLRMPSEGRYTVTLGTLEFLLKKLDKKEFKKMIKSELSKIEILLETGCFKTEDKTIYLTYEHDGSDETEKYRNTQELFNRILNVLNRKR